MKRKIDERNTPADVSAIMIIGGTSVNKADAQPMEKAELKNTPTGIAHAKHKESRIRFML